jgi:hypothetical protein
MPDWESWFVSPVVGSAIACPFDAAEGQESGFAGESVA